MTMFAWNKAWFHPRESLWSIANKIAFANACSVQQVLEYLGGVFSRQRERMLFPGVELVIKMAGGLGLDSRLAALNLFARLGEKQPLDIRELWRIGIRYCPVCLNSFIHRTEFQDSRNTLCSDHGARLLDVCPRCGRRLDPLCELPWSCNFCGFSLVEPGRKWYLDFEGDSAPGQPSELDLAALNPLTSSNGGAPTRVRLGDILYEEHAICAHSLAADHLDCLRTDGALEFAVYRPVSFRCPMAAATIVLAKRLGIFAQGATGGWSNSRPLISESTALRQLEYLLSEAPTEFHDSLIRDAVRAWYVEALSIFLTSAKTGELAVLWEPSLNDDLVLRKSGSQGPWVGKALSKVEQLVASATNFCSTQRANPTVL